MAFYTNPWFIWTVALIFVWIIVKDQQNHPITKAVNWVIEWFKGEH